MISMDWKKFNKIMGITLMILALIAYLNARGFASFEIIEIFDKGIRRDDTMALVESIFSGFLLVSGAILIKE